VRRGDEKGERQRARGTSLDLVMAFDAAWCAQTAERCESMTSDLGLDPSSGRCERAFREPDGMRPWRRRSVQVAVSEQNPSRICGGCHRAGQRPDPLARDSDAPSCFYAAKRDRLNSMAIRSRRCFCAASHPLFCERLGPRASRGVSCPGEMALPVAPEVDGGEQRNRADGVFFVTFR